MKKITLILLTAVLLGMCSKYRFNTITETDDLATQIGNVDDKYWRTDDKWSLSEKNLFESNYDLDCKINTNFKIIGYPNPCLDYFNVSFQKDSLTKVEVVLTNSSLNIFDEFTVDENSNNISFDISLGNPGYYRVYYKLIKDGCEFRGHGDILKME